MRWRGITWTSSLAAGAFLVACANGDEATGDGPGDADMGVPQDGGMAAEAASQDGGASDSGTGTPDSGATDAGGHDSGLGMDSAAPPDTGTLDSGRPDSGAVDSGVVLDATGVDVADVVIPDVAVPPGTVVCDYLGNSGGNLVVYIAECGLFGSSAPPCSGGCTGSSCCGALCTNSSNEAVCLPVPP
jgi:hypothetical protein